jgi:predicted ATPase/DNA-binding SARP family transcriptional activator
MLVEPWSVTLLGQLKADQNQLSIVRFRTRKAASLFAFLACHPARSHSREELADRFWPDDAPETSRTKLRLALTSLRHQLEPVGVQAGTVLFADRTHVRLNPDAVQTDVATFEGKLREATVALEPRERARLLAQALQAYGGDLLPGDYEEWALQERERLRHAHLDALTQVVELSTAQEDVNAAILYARRLVLADPLQEDAHVALMRLYLRANRPHDAAQQYAELTSEMREGFDSLPGEEAQALHATLPISAPRKSGVVSKGQTSRKRAARTAAERQTDAPSQVDPEQTARAASIPSSVTPTPKTSSSPLPPLSFDLRLPIFLTRCFGRFDAVRTLASLMDAGAHAEIEGNQDLHYDFNAAQRIETAPFPAGSTDDSPIQERLVTLIGPGGAGKTRLAVETARFLQTRVTYPMAFVSLAEVTDSGHILRHVADALHLPHTANADPMAQIEDRLRADSALLILDNFEQLTPDGVGVVQALLTRLPALRCLVTSRQHLGLPGERTFAVQPLPLSAAQQLFLDRAQAARPDFQITPHNSRAVAMLCEQLEGIPLALELAAAWIGVLTPAQMLTRMNRRFDLLISRREDRTVRHRALHAAIAWSYELLSPELQTFLTRLSVFRGGWTEQAAQEVGGVRHALHLLAQLRERSLVVSEESDREATMRFRLLESIREFMETQCDAALRLEMRRTHAAYFLRLAEQADKNIAGPDQAYWFACLEPEQPNIGAALDGLADEPDGVESQLRLTVAMRIFWRTQGHIAASRQRLDAILVRGGVEAYPAAYGAALVEVGLVASMQGDQVTARDFAQRALLLARREDDRGLAASALNTLGNAAKRLQEFDTARTLYTESLEISREISDRRSVATAIANLGNLAHEQGDYAQAATMYQESLDVYGKMQHKQGRVIQLYNLASLYVQTDDYVRAAPFLTECLTLCQELGDTPTMMHVFEVFGFIADEFAQPMLGVELYAAASRLRKNLGMPMSPRGQAYMVEVLAASRLRVGGERFDSLWQTGTDAPLEQTIEVAERIRVPAELSALDRAG